MKQPHARQQALQLKARIAANLLVVDLLRDTSLFQRNYFAVHHRSGQALVAEYVHVMEQGK